VERAKTMEYLRRKPGGSPTPSASSARATTFPASRTGERFEGHACFAGFCRHAPCDRFQHVTACGLLGVSSARQTERDV
jgi:hypothetical protein